MKQLFYMDFKVGISLQTQIKEMLVTTILDGHINTGDALPSCRELAKTLGVSRNTVVLAYDKLIEEGYVIARERKGFFVHLTFSECQAKSNPPSSFSGEQLDWSTKLRIKPSHQEHLKKPKSWRDCQFPFIYGQPDCDFFPIREWRESVLRTTQSIQTKAWLKDDVDKDDPLLIEQLRTRILARRGVRCHQDEILLTVGTQHCLFMLSQLIGGKGVRLGVENPGYPDARHIFELNQTDLCPLPIDHEGLIINDLIDDCDCLFVTPSHQSPSTVTLPLKRRLALLDKAKHNDIVIIEDDYECELNFYNTPTPALKSLDKDGRVIYVGSLSKTLAPGLRLGYMVAPADLITEARALRRLMMRHTPANNQRALAFFLASGHHDTMVYRLKQRYVERAECLQNALNQWLPEVTIAPFLGGSSVWLKGPKGMDSKLLQQEALKKGVFIETGYEHFYGSYPLEDAKRYFRLGFSLIKTDDIFLGIRLLSQAMERTVSDVRFAELSV
ncbi:MocR-like pyridoxine biosynthesis transcription factor PdxR [Vibrio sagamiensis]|uniref:GntR family transcriptional regulator n=1 Tax=Vibrio sagamiensis NBRC 104589 TaxID=1219064 RepID=A0A511QAW9_9VIBR|nr:PLP-dependent aminotransferase family protein [Vibrio sagamiensis]PNQ55050.1 PLP-dependent aminotransferase family protein [Vibrio agarivorans]GEM74415.1 GntR family transcriptional regulator [Vibrio sagamiensis NBRC 104589]